MRLPALALAALLLAGCFGSGVDATGGLVPYPRMGDVAVYEATGALVELARWNNGVPFLAASAQVRFTVSPSPPALDGARGVHDVFLLTTDVAEAGIFVKRSERWVSLRHEAVVQARYPLSTDQSVIAFDERGFPWMFGASALLGEDLADGAVFPFLLPDSLGRGNDILLSWRVAAREEGLVRLDLEGAPGIAGRVWMAPGEAWPARVELSLKGPELAPHVRSDGGYPVTLSARRISLSSGGEPLPARDRGATFGPDPGAARAPWDGEKPPDGDPASLEYPLADAVMEAKLLDAALAEWLRGRDTPILYRGTYQAGAGPVEGSRTAKWLLQFVDKGDEYYETQISRTLAPPLPVGLPRVEGSGPAEAPADPNHGWFSPDALPETLVTLSEGVRIVREVWGANDIEIYLRSFTDPPGYSYFIDGGFEPGGPGRYTVVYHPSTGFMEEATGPVTARLSPP